MAMLKDSLEGIVAWVDTEYPGRTSARADQDRDVTVFTVDPSDGTKRRSFEISDEALSDIPPETILADLRKARLLDRLRADESYRPLYTSQRTLVG